MQRKLENAKNDLFSSKNKPKPVKIPLVVQVISAGYEAGDYAQITVNGRIVDVEQNSDGHFRGLHIVVLNPKTGQVEFAKVFDTHKSPDEFEDFCLKDIPTDYIIVAACKDDCSMNISEVSKCWFSGMGSTKIWNVGYRQGFAFIGKMGLGKVIENVATVTDFQVNVQQVFIIKDKETVRIAEAKLQAAKKRFLADKQSQE